MNRAERIWDRHDCSWDVPRLSAAPVRGGDSPHIVRDAVPSSAVTAAAMVTIRNTAFLVRFRRSHGCGDAVTVFVALSVSVQLDHLFAAVVGVAHKTLPRGIDDEIQVFERDLSDQDGTVVGQIDTTEAAVTQQPLATSIIVARSAGGFNGGKARRAAPASSRWDVQSAGEGLGARG